MKIYIIEKSKKINSKITVSQFSIKPFNKKMKNVSRHSSMTEICRALFKY